MANENSHNAVDSAFSGDEDIELHMSRMEDSAHRPNSRQAKRKTVENLDAEATHKRLETFSSALYVKVFSIDSKKQLNFYEYFDDKDDDPVVSEYLKNLVQLEFVPQLPDLPSENPNFITQCQVKSDISTQCRKLITPLLMSYFQSRNFKDNIEKANQHNKAVANPNMKLFMPAFQFAPKQNLEQVTELKTKFAIEVQELHCKSALFIAEFLLLRAGVLIHDDLKDKVSSEAELKEETQNHFSIMYLKCLMEFTRKFKIKNTDFETYQTKITHSESKWRKTDTIPPPLTKNHYATDMMSKISKNEYNFQPQAIATEFNSFLTEDLTKAPPSRHPHHSKAQHQQHSANKRFKAPRRKFENRNQASSSSASNQRDAQPFNPHIGPSGRNFSIPSLTNAESNNRNQQRQLRTEERNPPNLPAFLNKIK